MNTEFNISFNPQATKSSTKNGLQDSTALIETETSLGLKGYGMIFCHELKLMNDNLSPPEVADIIYNVCNLIMEVHGNEHPEDLPLTRTQNAFYCMIAQRLKRNIRNASKKKKGGAPKGNQNARKKGAEKIKREEVVKEVKRLRLQGLSLRIIGDICGVSRSTVRNMLKEVEQEETVK